MNLDNLMMQAEISSNQNRADIMPKKVTGHLQSPDSLQTVHGNLQ